MIYRTEIALPPMAKARPRVTRNGAYMPKPYQQWREKFVILSSSPNWTWSDQVCKPCRNKPKPLVYHSFSLYLTIITKSGKMRPDLDNAAGAVLDALQDASVIENDSDCWKLVAMIEKGDSPKLVIELETA